MRIFLPVSSLALFTFLLSGYAGAKTVRSYQAVAGGNAIRGEQVIAQYKCGSCHTIPGIRNAKGVFGPPLTDWADRGTIAGDFPNNPKTLVSWLKSPTSMKPATAMPDLGLSEQQARDAAQYLETLH